MRTSTVVMLSLMLFACTTDSGKRADTTSRSSGDSLGVVAQRGEVKEPDMDLVGDSTDENGFRYNHTWRIQKTAGSPVDTRIVCGGFVGKGADFGPPPTYGKPGEPPCTKEADSLTVDYGGVLHFTCTYRFKPADRGFHGHINWYPATYSGVIHYEGSSEVKHGVAQGLGDKDLNFGLIPPKGEALTRYNGGFLIAEMDRKETAGLWKSTWWRDFAAHVNRDADIKQRVDSHRARIIGLFGLDGVHDFHTELHPIYAMALLLDPAKRDASNDRWAVFARNSGNQGYCSKQIHSLNAPHDTLKVELDWLDGAVSATLDESVEPFSVRGQGTHFVGLHVDQAAKRLALVFVLPAATSQLALQDRAMVDGVAKIKWTMAPGAPRTIALKAPAYAPGTPAVDEAESLLDSLIGTLSDKDRKALFAQVQAIDAQQGDFERRQARGAGVLVRREKSDSGTISRAMTVPTGPRRDVNFASVDSIERVRDSIIAGVLCPRLMASQRKQACGSK